MSKRTRNRQLARVAQRRAWERRRQQRRRNATIAAAVAVALVGGGFVALAVTRGRGVTPRASGSPGPSGSPSPTVSPGTQTGTVTPSPAPKVVACGATAPADAGKPKPQFNEPANVTKPGESYTATMQTSCGTIVIALEPKLAPNTVNSIVFLAGQHLFDGTTFHRIAKGFVIQGGDPMGTGSGGPGYTTVDPPPSGAKYPVGTVAMAKASTDPAGTSGSQFFIVTSPSAQAALAPGGTGQYAIVGKVVSGIDIVRRIAALPIHGGGTDGAPAQAVYIDSLRVKAEAR